jgi:Ca-activated chloride channel family protein
VARFLTSAPEEEDITTALDEVLADWAEPVLSGLRLEVSRPSVQASARRALDAGEAGWSAVDLGDLPAARAVWVAGRVPRGEAGELAFRVRTRQNRDVALTRLDLAKEADGRPALRALFGAGRVRALESLRDAGYSLDEVRARLERLGYDPGGVVGGQGKVFVENARADVRAALEKLLVRESLEFGLASAATAFVAVRTEPGKPVEETLVVANALPAGWSEEIFGSLLCAAPAGATGVRTGGHAVTARASWGIAPRHSVDSVKGVTRSSYSGGAAAARAPTTRGVSLFSDIPSFTNGEAVLFDSAGAGSGRLPDDATIAGVEVRFPGGTPEASSLGADLCLLIFVDDLASPRARVRLADLVRQRGERPLNLRKQPGQAVRLVLVDPAGKWGRGAPRLEVALRCQGGG